MKKIIRYKLKNGLSVILAKKPGMSVALQVMVKSGSNHETAKIRGIAHFIEHMVFEGTSTRSSLDIANEIEAIGGEFNAGTSNEYTIYYIHILKKHIKKAIEVLSDVMKNPIFDKDDIERQRKVILDEVNLVTDDPRFHQWVLFQQALYKRYPARFPVYGNKHTIQNIQQKDFLRFFKNNYSTDNMILSIVGDFNAAHVLELIKQSFCKMPKKCSKKAFVYDESLLKKNIMKKERRKLLQSYIVLGFPTVKRVHKDSYVLDVIKAILGRGQSGKLYQEIRTKRGLAYEVGVHNDSSVYSGFLSLYANTHKKNIKKIKDIFLEELKNLDNLTTDELKDAKESIEGAYGLRNEDNCSFSESLCFWEYSGNVKLALDYVRLIKRVTKKDILKVRERYLSKHHVFVMIEQL